MVATQNDSKKMELLARLTEPATTAILTMELQNGIVGSGALLPALVNAVAECGLLAVAGSVCSAARGAGVRVVHCTMEERSDWAGFVENCKLSVLSAKQRRANGCSPIEVGSFGAQSVPELNVQPSDIVVARMTGMTPFTSTSLDQILRNMGIKTVVVMGVSVNIGVMGTVLSAVDLGYQVVIVRDAVAGVPAAYAQAAIDNSLSMISTVATAKEILACWETPAARDGRQLASH